MTSTQALIDAMYRRNGAPALWARILPPSAGDEPDTVTAEIHGGIGHDRLLGHVVLKPGNDGALTRSWGSCDRWADWAIHEWVDDTAVEIADAQGVPTSEVRADLHSAIVHAVRREVALAALLNSGDVGRIIRRDPLRDVLVNALREAYEIGFKAGTNG